MGKRERRGAVVSELKQAFSCILTDNWSTQNTHKRQSPSVRIFFQLYLVNYIHSILCLSVRKAFELKLFYQTAPGE